MEPHDQIAGPPAHDAIDAGIGPSSTRRARNALCSFVTLPGAPGDTLLMRPSGPCSLNRITQSRSVCRSMPPIFAASCRAAPSRRRHARDVTGFGGAFLQVAETKGYTALLHNFFRAIDY